MWALLYSTLLLNLTLLFPVQGTLDDLALRHVVDITPTPPQSEVTYLY